MLEANKKQFPLKSYSPKVKIDSAYQILKIKEKVTETYKIYILTRITDQNVYKVCIVVCIVVFIKLIKNQVPGPYNSLHRADNRNCFQVSFSGQNLAIST